MQHHLKHRDGEHGGAGVKFLIFLGLIMLVAHAGYNYVPVAYSAESLRTDMHAAVLQGLALPGKVNPVDNVKTRIARSIEQNQIPPEALVEVKQAGNVLTAHVAYSQNVNLLPFGLYKYSYHFDHTATPTGFLLKQ